MNKRRRKIIFLSVGLLCMGSPLWIAFSWKDLRRFPRIISRWYAKEYCSCLFVMKRDEPFCEERVRQWLPIQQRSVDESKARVTVTGLGHTAHAAWMSAEEGCRLIDTEPSQ